MGKCFWMKGNAKLTRRQYLDFGAGLCGVAACQIIPPMSPSIMALHEQFQRGIYQSFGPKKK